MIKRSICSGPVSRRVCLQAGASAIGGLSLPQLMRLRAEATPPGQKEPDTAVLLVWLQGGPPHMETYDLKPDAPLEYRGEFRPIHTNVPGLDVCELLPLHAGIADKFTLVRSISHEFADHGGGTQRFLTSRAPKRIGSFVNDSPHPGAVVAKAQENRAHPMPRSIVAIHGGTIDTYGNGAAYLGPSYAPFLVTGDPSAPQFEIPNLSVSKEFEHRLSDRALLLKNLDRMRREVDHTRSMVAMDKYNERAMDLLLSEEARKAFDLSLESPETRARYGHHSWGQRALMGLRLIEAGSSFVSVLMENPSKPGSTYPKQGAYNWDSHAVNAHIFADARFRLPILDMAISALIEDIYRRGLDKRIMLIVAGEFGRTPKIEYSIGTQTGVLQPGRDHWPNSMSVLVSGAGMRTGQVVGSTNAKGEVPKDRPLKPNDLWATAYRHLGIDFHQAYPDLTGRPMPILTEGEPISELC